MKKRTRILTAAAAALVAAGVVGAAAGPALAGSPAPAASKPAAPQSLAVGTQYDFTHVYVQPGTANEFIKSWEATFGGAHTTPVTTDVTPTSSSTISILEHSPVGSLSVFDFKTPIPYPFGTERVGYMVTSLPAGYAAALQAGATTLVTPFNDPIGEDTVVQFPGGVDEQLYHLTNALNYPAPTTVPQQHVYLTEDTWQAFVASWNRFSGGRVVSDNAHADGAQIGLPGTTFRKVELSSKFGVTDVFVTDGHLPYPFGRENTGYGVTSVATTLQKAQAAGAKVLWSAPAAAGQPASAMLQFPGGYIAEISTAS